MQGKLSGAISRGIFVQKINYTKHNWLVFKHAQKWLNEWAGYIRGTVYDLGFCE